MEINLSSFIVSKKKQSKKSKKNAHAKKKICNLIEPVTPKKDTLVIRVHDVDKKYVNIVLPPVIILSIMKFLDDDSLLNLMECLMNTKFSLIMTTSAKYEEYCQKYYEKHSKDINHRNTNKNKHHDFTLYIKYNNKISFSDLSSGDIFYLYGDE